MEVRFGVIKSQSIAHDCSFNRDEYCASRGYGVDAALIACEFLNLTCHFEWYNDTAYGDYNITSGQPYGLIEAIYNGRYDTSVPVFTPTYTRNQVVSFSDSLFYADVVAVTRAPNDDHSLTKVNWNFVLTFDWPTWLAIVISLIITCLLVSYAQGGLDHHMHRKKVLNFTETALSLLTRQYKSIAMSPSSAVFMVTVWAAVFIVLTSSYTGELFSQKMNSNANPPYKNLDEMADCVAKGKCSIVVSSPSASYFQLLRVPGSAIAAKLDSVLQSTNPLKVIKDKPELARTVLKEREKYLVWVTSRNDFQYYLNDHKNESSSFYVVSMPYDDNCGFVVRKNATKLLRKFNMFANHFRQGGLDTEIGSRYFTSSTEMDGGSQDIFVEFFEILVIMYFYVAGLGCALISLGCEIHYVKHGKVID